MSNQRTICAATVAVALCLSLSPRRANCADVTPVGFQTQIRPLLEANCFKCHNAEKHKGGVDLASLTDDKTALRRRKLWRAVIAQIEPGDMPPDTEKPLAPVQKAALLKWMRQAAEYVDCSSLDPGPAPVRRLNRTEYNFTIRDLVGLDFEAGEAVGMPDEGVVKGFDNLATALSLPPTLLEKYFAAADKILDAVFSGTMTNSPVKLDGAKKKQARLAYDKLVFMKPGNGVTERDAAKQIISKFLRRAYRRPVSDAEVEKFLKLFDRATAAGEDFDRAVRAMLKPALISPHFLFRIEQDEATKGQPHRVSDHELAVRLSYFLWATMPDDELFRLADEGKLHEPAVLDQQVKRMLADPKARALTEQFAAQWLQLGKLASARPSTEFFPAFNDKLRKAMREEATMFFDKLREEDRSVLELIDADYTYLNKDLAKHYGIAGVTNTELRRVCLRPEDHRGGLLGMGAVLAMTSHTHRTSPTQRGKYILEVVFGTPPPPPPANAGVLKEEKKKDPRTFREQLAQHAADPTCAGCHKKMDPLGFALDNYDAVGAWRESTPEKPLDTSGQLPTGEKFNGVSELKQILQKRQNEFVHNLVEQSLAYALGRELQDSDECAVREVQSALAANRHKFSELVLGVVKSHPFQHRKNSDSLADAAR